MIEQECSLIAGLTLGDGSINCDFDRQIYTITVNHSCKQKDYLEWKKSLMLQELVGSVTEYHNIKNDCYYVFFRNANVVKKSYDIFYSSGKKSITPYLKYLKEPRNLALWFMDDGGLLRKKKRKSSGELYWLRPSINLATHCFNLEEIEDIKRFFKRELGIVTLIHKDKGKYHRLYFNANESKKVWAIIREYVMQIPSMRDKFDLFIHFYENCGDSTADYINELNRYSKIGVNN